MSSGPQAIGRGDQNYLLQLPRSGGFAAVHTAGATGAGRYQAKIFQRPHALADDPAIGVFPSRYIEFGPEVNRTANRSPVLAPLTALCG